MKSQVIVVPCDSYEEEEVYRQLRAGLALLGGLHSLIDPQESVLLKLNLVRGAAAERAVTTHPAVAAAVARIFSEEGYAHLAAGDSPGFGAGEKVMRDLGLAEPFARFGVQMAAFDEAVPTDFPEGIHAKHFQLARDVLQADALVSVCKMKAHALERITGAVKNQYGCVQGGNKAKGHTQYPSAESLARMVVDLNRLVKPRLFIMDGVVAMEGNGPTSGDPVPMKLLLLGTDPVAIDAVFARLVYLDPQLVPTCAAGMQMGLGTCDEAHIEVLVPQTHAAGAKERAAGADTEPAQGGYAAADGAAAHLTVAEAVRRFGKSDFRVERGARHTKGWMGWLEKLQVFSRRPVILADRCKTCGVCVQSCPVEGKALHFTNGRRQPPVYDYKKCIRCYCCQEMCPHKAITVKGRGGPA